MLPMRRFRCYAFRDGPFWYADCLDLMLLVKRESLPAAMQELELLILDHVQAARDGSGAPMPRPVKFGDRLAFLGRAFGHSLRVLFTGRTGGLVSYEVHIPTSDPELKIVYAWRYPTLTPREVIAILKRLLERSTCALTSILSLSNNRKPSRPFEDERANAPVVPPQFAAAAKLRARSVRPVVFNRALAVTG